MKGFTLISLLIAGSNFPILAQSVVIDVPNSLAQSGGNTSQTGGPFSLQGTTSSTRWQQVLDASQFSQLSENGGYLFYLLVRPESPYGIDLPRVQINFSTTPRAPDQLSTVFAENIGSNEQVIFDGQVRGIMGVNVAFECRQPFFYNPAAGNLLVDIRTFAGMDGVPGSEDLEWVTGDSISSVVGLDVNSPTGITETGGLIFTFVVEPIPEPSSLSLLLLGGLAIACAGRRFRPPVPEKHRNLCGGFDAANCRCFADGIMRS